MEINIIENIILYKYRYIYKDDKFVTSYNSDRKKTIFQFIICV